MDLHIDKDPLECFAVACETDDFRLAKQAIAMFDPTYQVKAVLSSWRCDSTVRFAAKANPANWDLAYIERLGLKHYSQYVKAWHAVVFRERRLLQRNTSDRQLLSDLAKAFTMDLGERGTSAAQYKDLRLLTGTYRAANVCTLLMWTDFLNLPWCTVLEVVDSCRALTMDFFAIFVALVVGLALLALLVIRSY